MAFAYLAVSGIIFEHLALDPRVLEPVEKPIEEKPIFDLDIGAAADEVHILEKKPATDDRFMEIAIFILCLVLMGVCMCLIIKAIVNRRKKFLGQPLDEVTEERSFIQGKKHKKKTGWFARKTSDKRQIRWLYAKHIQAVDGYDSVLPWETTAGIQGKAYDLGFDNSEDIRDLYRDVRYGNKRASKADVKRLKSMV